MRARHGLVGAPLSDPGPAALTRARTTLSLSSSLPAAPPPACETDARSRQAGASQRGIPRSSPAANGRAPRSRMASSRGRDREAGGGKARTRRCLFCLCSAPRIARVRRLGLGRPGSHRVASPRRAHPRRIEPPRACVREEAPAINRGAPARPVRRRCHLLRRHRLLVPGGVAEWVGGTSLRGGALKSTAGFGPLLEQ
ncbi:hypothetical protein PAHAL_7G216400 [Panicum hallii]|uniref:Uncharacterized protein n=1 Tax=Panicum hallii TaxID=206008 RepID=A0A2T8ID50_9POAL|nr:hypothetical protein PAHAL_7G216400 [Panicum hallii]